MKTFFLVLWFLSFSVGIGIHAGVPLSREETEIKKLELQFRRDLLDLQKQPESELRATRIREIELQLQNIREISGKIEEVRKLSTAFADRTAGVSDICPVHKMRMRVQLVQFYYGDLMRRTDGLSEAEFLVRFPFAGEAAYGGIEPNEFLPPKAKVYVCKRCVTASKSWHESTGMQNKFIQPTAIQPGADFKLSPAAADD